VLDQVLTGPNRELSALAGGAPVADIGAADGDVAFFLESLGFTVDIIDNGPTNMNGLEGARKVKQALGSNAALHRGRATARHSFSESFTTCRTRFTG